MRYSVGFDVLTRIAHVLDVKVRFSLISKYLLKAISTNMQNTGISAKAYQTIK